MIPRIAFWNRATTSFMILRKILNIPRSNISSKSGISSASNTSLSKDNAAKPIVETVKSGAASAPMYMKLTAAA